MTVATGTLKQDNSATSRLQQNTTDKAECCLRFIVTVNWNVQCGVTLGHLNEKRICGDGNHRCSAQLGDTQALVREQRNNDSNAGFLNRGC